MKILYPLVWIVNGITASFLFLFGLRNKNDGGNPLTSEELRTVVNEAGSLIPRRHQDMLLSILDLENVTVVDVMILAMKSRRLISMMTGNPLLANSVTQLTAVSFYIAIPLMKSLVCFESVKLIA